MPDMLFFCECGSTALAISRFNWDDEGEEFWVEISPWTYMPNRPLFFNSLRHIWHIIRYGHPYQDFVMVRPEKARALGEYLIECTTRASTATISSHPAPGDKEI
jgi:hypothetical protein